MGLAYFRIFSFMNNFQNFGVLLRPYIGVRCQAKT